MVILEDEFAGLPIVLGLYSGISPLIKDQKIDAKVSEGNEYIKFIHNGLKL